MSTENYLQTFRTAIARVYHINGKTVVGTGFLVGDRYLLTCTHVVTEALSVRSNTQEMPSGTMELDFPLIAPGQKVKAKVVFWQPVNPGQIGEDIAGLHLEDSPPTGVSATQLVTASDYWGHAFRIFGFPQGHDLGVWATGELRDSQATGWIQMEAIRVPGYQVEPGFSGAPVWDELSQKVAGMAIAAERKREGVKAAFMIPTKVLVQTWSLLNQAVGQQTIIFQPLSRVQVIKAKELNKRLKILKPYVDSDIISIKRAYQASCPQGFSQQADTIEDILEILQDIRDNAEFAPINRFAALLTFNPNWDVTVQKEVIPFAKIAMQVLLQLGEDYAVLAEHLERKSPGIPESLEVFNNLPPIQTLEFKVASITIISLQSFEFRIATLYISMIVCPNCNHPNPNEAVQCEACYTPLPGPTYCPRCGATVQADAAFCGQCGYNLHYKENIESEIAISFTEYTGQYFVEDLGNGIELDMVLIKSGRFIMGSPEDELERDDSESPQLLVNIQQFCIGKYPVTQAQWRAVAALPQVNRGERKKVWGRESS